MASWHLLTTATSTIQTYKSTRLLSARILWLVRTWWTAAPRSRVNICPKAPLHLLFKRDEAGAVYSGHELSVSVVPLKENWLPNHSCCHLIFIFLIRKHDPKINHADVYNYRFIGICACISFIATIIARMLRAPDPWVTLLCRLRVPFPCCLTCGKSVSCVIHPAKAWGGAHSITLQELSSQRHAKTS